MKTGPFGCARFHMCFSFRFFFRLHQIYVFLLLFLCLLSFFLCQIRGKKTKIGMVLRVLQKNSNKDCRGKLYFCCCTKLGHVFVSSFFIGGRDNLFLEGINHDFYCSTSHRFAVANTHSNFILVNLHGYVLQLSQFYLWCHWCGLHWRQWMIKVKDLVTLWTGSLKIISTARALLYFFFKNRKHH